jgi:hypothetical protein
MPDRAPLDEVVTRLLALRDAGRPAGEAAQAAASLGWKPEEIKGALASAPPGWLGSLAQGATFGFGDEIRAGVQAAERKLGGEDFGPAYQDELGKARAAQALFQHAHPVGDVALQAAGSLPFAGAAGGAETLAGAAAKGALTGAVSGGLYGAGTGTDAADRTGRALFGAVTGGVAGGVLAPTVEGLVGATRMQAAPGAVARRSLARAVADEGMTPATAAQAVADANATGKTGVGLADVMQGGRVSGLLRDVAQSPNPAQAAVRTQIEGRQLGQFERVIGDLGDAAGVGGRRAVSTANQIMEDRSRDAAGDFARAWTFDAASSPDARDAFAGLMHTDAGARAYQRAAQLARNEMPGAPVPRLDELIDPETGAVRAMPNMQFLHYLKMGLDDLHSSAVSGGESGMGRTVARSIAGVRNNFRDALAAANPDYGVALGRFAGHSALADALETGRQAITQSSDEFAAALHDLGSPGEQEMFRLGAVSRLSDMLGKQSRGPTADFTRQLRSIGMEQKLPLLIGDPAATDLFTRRLGLERAFSGTATRVAGNSATSEGRELADLAEGNQSVGDLLHQVRSASGPTSFLMGLFDHTIGKLAKPMAAAFKSRFRGEMGGMLGRTDADAVDLLRRLAQRGPAPAYRGPQAAIPGAAGLTNALLPQPQPDPWAGSGIALGR